MFPRNVGIVKTECDGTSAETRFGLPAKRTSPFISAGVSVHSSTGWTMFRVKLKTAGYPLHSPLSPSLLLPCFAVCHQIPFPLYLCCRQHVVSPQKMAFFTLGQYSSPKSERISFTPLRINSSCIFLKCAIPVFSSNQ